MEEKKLVPKLRFPGFTEPWEQRTFSELFEYERPDAYIVQSDLYCDEYNVPVLTANKAFILGYTNEECTYNKPSIIFDDFTLDRKYVDFPYMLKSSAIKILTAKENHNLRFLFERLNSTRFEVLGHARHYISVVQNTSTLCPTLDEENCISTILTKVDTLITLHQRKLEHLKLKKKSLLQKLFPKEGEVYPELRFPGFTDPWEQRKLGDVVGITSGFMGDSLLSDGKYHLTRIETIADGIVDENRVGYSNEKPDDMYLLKHGDILYSNINSISHMGKVAKYQGNSPLYHGINLLRLQPENNINSDFLLYLLNTEKCRNWAKTRANQAVSQASINQSLLTTQEIAISSFEEQKKIGDYFRNLDHLITLHQRKLEHLQLLKKALLQQLFV